MFAETILTATAAFFATIGPFDVAAVYAVLTTRSRQEEKRAMAIRGVLLAGVILLVFALVGTALLERLGISMPAFRAAGGVLLLLVGIEMVFARDSTATSTTPEEQQEAQTRQDISVFPLAMPLIAGPGSMSVAMLFFADAAGQVGQQVAVLLGLFLVLVLTLVAMLLANKLHKLLGITGMHVIARVFGVLLSALAVQFIFDGIKQSGIFA